MRVVECALRQGVTGVSARANGGARGFAKEQAPVQSYQQKPSSGFFFIAIRSMTPSHKPIYTDPIGRFLIATAEVLCHAVSVLSLFGALLAAGILVPLQMTYALICFMEWVNDGDAVFKGQVCLAAGFTASRGVAWCMASGLVSYASYWVAKRARALL